MFGTIETRVRPIRLAHLVDPDNIKQVREAIQLSSSLWGGSHFPIIPLHKRMPATWKDGPIKAPPAKDVILGYLEAFDPDVLVQFPATMPSYIAELGLQVIRPDEIWEPLEKEDLISPKFGIGIFEILNEVFEKDFKYQRKYPIKVVVPRIPDQLSLFWASWFGEIHPKLYPVLEKHYFKPMEIEAIDFQPDKLLDVMNRNVLFPRRIVLEGLQSHSRFGFRKDAYLYFLDATDVGDIVDYWNFRAMGKQVVPLPKQLKEDPQLNELVSGFLKAHRRPWAHNREVCDFATMVRARHCTMEEMQEYAKTIKIDHAADDTSKDPFFSLQHWYPRVWDAWARDKDGAVPHDVYGKEGSSIDINETAALQFRFKPLLPKFAEEHAYHGQPRCANEIGFRFYGTGEYLAEVLPKSTGENMARAISGLTSLPGEWRVARNGLVKLVKDKFVETREIPTAENIVFAWLTDLGWKPKLSPPGLLAKQIMRKFDGYSGFFRNDKLLGLLEHMNGGLVKRDGSPAEKNEINQERDLAVGEVKNRIETPQGRLYDHLLSKGVFKLGLRIRCPHCVRNFWLPLQDIADHLTCPKCQEVFPAIGIIDSATWSLKTAGPFSVPGYADGAYAVLVALDFMGNFRLSTTRTTPVFSFIGEAAGKRPLEADFALFWEESMYGERKDGTMFGECKTYGKFASRDFERMRYLAKTFPGAILAFCTLRRSLGKEEVVQITRIAKAGRKHWKPERPVNPVLILTGTELLSYPGPPSCWEDALKQKLGHRRGLLDICDATQQIYLGLPSWQADWREKWDKKRQRRQARRALMEEKQE